MLEGRGGCVVVTEGVERRRWMMWRREGRDGEQKGHKEKGEEK